MIVSMVGISTLEMDDQTNGQNGIPLGVVRKDLVLIAEHLPDAKKIETARENSVKKIAQTKRSSIDLDPKSKLSSPKYYESPKDGGSRLTAVRPCEDEQHLQQENQQLKDAIEEGGTTIVALFRLRSTMCVIATV